MARDWDAFLLPGRTLIMGILNATPDSFFSESRISKYFLNSAVERARTMVDEGAHIIDIGAESTRPGASYIEESEEIDRLIPLLAAVRAAVTVPISVDTRKSSVARMALEAGADIINDISAGEDDSSMFACAAKYGSPVILMHKQGQPQTMQLAPAYTDPIADISQYLSGRAERARNSGIQHVIVDPGLGFGKSFDDNLSILNGLGSFTALGYPVLVGHSRKGFIGTALEHHGKSADVQNRLFGTIAVSLWCAERGVSILRVHDVKPNAEALRVFSVLTARSQTPQWSLNHA